VELVQPVLKATLVTTVLQALVVPLVPKALLVLPDLQVAMGTLALKATLVRLAQDSAFALQ
jgi:hypothetical protein